MSELLTTPAGSLALAITALLLVLGHRLASPRRAAEWLGVGAYAAALVVQLLGARGLLPGAVLAPGTALRVLGGVLLVSGLVVAGTAARARRRAASAAVRRHAGGPGGASGATPPARAARPARLDPVHAGLALVAAGQLLRAPSVAGAIAVLAAVIVNAVVAMRPAPAAGTP